MPYLPRKTVEKNVKIRVRTTASGKKHADFEAYVGYDPFGRKAVRITRVTKEKLRNALTEFYGKLRYSGDAAMRLTAMQSIDAAYAIDMLASAGVKKYLHEVVEEYIDSKIMMNDGKVTDMNVQDAYRDYFDMKHEGADKEKTRATTGRWVNTLGDRKLSTITAKEISEYLKTNFAHRKPKTYNSHFVYIRTFLNWCCKEERKYLAGNPMKTMTPMAEPWEEPEYMKPADVEKLFRLLESDTEHPERLAYAIVSFFCGSRSIEIQRLAALGDDAVKINLEDETVRIAKGKGYQCGKSPRAFHIEATALKWMKSFDFMTAVKRITADTQPEIYGIARAHGIPVFQNCGRHSFITYHVAAFGDPAKTQAIVGTSAKMRADNYCGLASRADGIAYFGIWPKAESAASAASA